MSMLRVGRLYGRRWRWAFPDGARVLPPSDGPTGDAAPCLPGWWPPMPVVDTRDISQWVDDGGRDA